jgi:Ca2+/Na+ antiporter
MDGTPQVGLGDALGSNVVNLGLVLGSRLAIPSSVLSAARTEARAPIWISRFARSAV